MEAISINGYVFWSVIVLLSMGIGYLICLKASVWFQKRKSGANHESDIVGVKGMITRPVQPGVVGRIHFLKPWRGQEDWDVVSAHQLRIGSIGQVVKFDNGSLVIERYEG